MSLFFCSFPRNFGNFSHKENKSYYMLDPWQCHEWEIVMIPVIQRERKPCYCEKNNSKSSDNEALRRVRGMKGRWERQERQSFPAACWHTHWWQGHNPTGFHFLSAPSHFIFICSPFLIWQHLISEIWCPYPPHPTTLTFYLAWHTVNTHPLKFVTHTTHVLNESTEKAIILAAFVFTDPIYI